MKTIYYLFGFKAVRIYTEEGFDELRTFIVDMDSSDYSLFVYDEDMTPSGLLSAYNGFEDFAELTEEEFNILVKDNTESDETKYFQVEELDNIEAGSFGVIKGDNNIELNDKLQDALFNVYETVMISDVVDFSFWKKRHSENIDVTVVTNGVVETKTIKLTYTWLV